MRGEANSDKSNQGTGSIAGWQIHLLQSDNLMEAESLTKIMIKSWKYLRVSNM